MFPCYEKEPDDWIAEDIKEIQSILRNHSHWEFSWVPRRKKNMAHSLAKWAATSLYFGLLLLDYIPRSICCCDNVCKPPWCIKFFVMKYYHYSEGKKIYMYYIYICIYALVFQSHVTYEKIKLKTTAVFIIQSRSTTNR